VPACRCGDLRQGRAEGAAGLLQRESDAGQGDSGRRGWRVRYLHGRARRDRGRTAGRCAPLDAGRTCRVDGRGRQGSGFLMHYHWIGAHMQSRHILAVLMASASFMLLSPAQADNKAAAIDEMEAYLDFVEYGG